MSTPESNHDTLAHRLTQILLKLNQGDRLDPVVLAEEFAVSRRTIQRDLNERFSFLPIEKQEEFYCLDPAYLGRITLNDIKRFAALAGIGGMFPVLTSSFLRELFDSRLQETVLIRPMSYENIQKHRTMFQQCQYAILHQQAISFDYRKKDASKRITVQPYKLVHQQGVWYLAAVDGEVLKTYTVSRISQMLTHSNQVFERQDRFEQQLEEDDSIWLNQNKITVTLKVSPYAANYFRQKQLISAQTIEQALEDGSLIISGKYAHSNQILPIVRSWIPDVEILSPDSLREQMETELLAYLNKKR